MFTEQLLSGYLRNGLYLDLILHGLILTWSWLSGMLDLGQTFLLKRVDRRLLHVNVCIAHIVVTYSRTPNGLFVDERVTFDLLAHREYWLFLLYPFDVVIKGARTWALPCSLMRLRPVV